MSKKNAYADPVYRKLTETSDIDRWIAAGNERDCSYPSKGVPKLRENPEPAESLADLVFFSGKRGC